MLLSHTNNCILRFKIRNLKTIFSFIDEFPMLNLFTSYLKEKK